jgi:hypothetical protein
MTRTRLKPEHMRYVAVETSIGVVIGIALSALFYWLLFAGVDRVRWEYLLLDAVPQSFMLTFMTVLVPTFITRRRIARGKIAPIDQAVIRLPSNFLFRALMVAGLAVVPGVLTTGVFLMLFASDGLAYPAALWFKMLYGALLALLVAPIGLQAALADSSLSKR